MREPTPDSTHAVRPLAALAHPAWWCALATLVLNDHVLKGAGLVPGWLTGKLSDVAGLVVAPPLLAALAGVRTRRGLLACVALTGGVFAALEVSPAAARASEALMAWAGWRVWPDLTDLAALPALGLAWALVVAASRRRAPVPAGGRRLVSRAATVLGAAACVATSQPRPRTDAGPGEPIQVGEVDVLATSRPLTFRARRLRPGVVFACNHEAASALLGAEHFGQGERWALQANSVASFNNRTPTRACDAVLLESDTAPPAVVVWRAGERTRVTLETDASGRPAWLRRSVSTGRPGPAQPLAPPAPAPATHQACGGAAAGRTVAVDAPASGSFRWLAARAGADGCVAIELEAEPRGAADPAARAYVCGVPLAALPFDAGDVVTVQRNDTQPGATTLRIARADDGLVVTIAARTSTAPWFHLLVAASLDECTSAGPCDERLRPLSFVRSPASGWRQVSGDGEAPVYEQSTLSGTTTVYVLRAVHALVADTACVDGSRTFGNSLDYATVERTARR